MGTAYKYFGLPSDRDNPLSVEPLPGTGLHGEYNSTLPDFQPRINDVYIYCPPFGEDVANSVIWTPAVQRLDPNDGVAKSFYSIFSVEEFLGATLYGWPYSNNPNSLQASGITLYIKLKDETTASEPQVREEKGPYQEIQRIAGVCAETGTIVQTGIGNTFGWTQGWAMCLGLRMDKKHVSGTQKTKQIYYVVNRATSNDRELIWRISFDIGINSRGSYSAGTTLPFATYLLSNPYVADPVNGVTLVHPNYPGGTYFITIGSTADEAFSKSSNWSDGRGKLAIEYNTVFAITSTNKPSGQTWGTDNPTISFPDLDPDYRPYIVNSVPIL